MNESINQQSVPRTAHRPLKIPKFIDFSRWTRECELLEDELEQFAEQDLAPGWLELRTAGTDSNVNYRIPGKELDYLEFNSESYQNIVSTLHKTPHLHYLDKRPISNVN